MQGPINIRYIFFIWTIQGSILTYILAFLTPCHHTIADTSVSQNVAIITFFHTPLNSLFTITFNTEMYADQSAILTDSFNKS